MKLRHYLMALVVAMFSLVKIHAQGTAFAYQGQLRDGGTNANGAYTMIFKLYDAPGAGNQVGNGITNSVTLVNGIFSVSLDFGSTPFDGNLRWLDTTVINGSTTETLSPRVQLLPTPYSIYAANAGQLANADWSVRTGPFDEFTNVFQIFDGPFFVMGMISNGVLVNGDFNSTKLSTGNISADSMDLSPNAYINFTGTNNNNAEIRSDGNMGIYVGGPLTLQNSLTFNDGTSLTTGGQGSLVASGDLITSNMAFYGSILRFSSRNGATLFVETNGDFIFDNGINLSATGVIKLPAPGQSTVSLTGYGSHTLGVDGIVQGTGFNVANPLGGFTLIDGVTNGIALHGGLTIPFGDIRINSGGMVVGGNIAASTVQASGAMTASAFNTTSDRNAKENFAPVDPREVLDRVAALPISRWNFKTDNNTRHIGPMAQDFYQAFNVGTDERHIATVDEDGVALAAIQGLNEKLKEKDAQIESLEKRLAEVEKLVKSQDQTTEGAK